jgi:hypothetical protein
MRAGTFRQRELDLGRDVEARELATLRRASPRNREFKSASVAALERRDALVGVTNDGRYDERTPNDRPHETPVPR